MFLATEAIQMKGLIAIYIFLQSLHWGITGYWFGNCILFISPLWICALLIRVFPQYIAPLSIRVPFLWGYRVCIFFTPFNSCTLLEMVPRMHIVYMPCLCQLGQNDMNPFDSTPNAHAYAMSCSLNNSIMSYALFQRMKGTKLELMSWAK